MDVALILAAGRGSRLQTPIPKPLLPVAGQPLLRRSLAPYLKSRLDSIVVVLGYAAAEIRAALDEPVDWLEHPDWARGLGSSLAWGVRHLPAQTERLLIGLGDMPWLQASTLTRLLASDAPRCVPAYRGRRGHPVLFGRADFPDLAGLAGDRGAAGLLRDRETEMLEVDDPGIHWDVDRLTDLDRPRNCENRNPR